MSDVTHSAKIQLLKDFLDALNRHDADAMMSFMSDDCMFEKASGPDKFGYRHHGSEDVRAGYESLWNSVPDAQWEVTSIFVSDDRACSEWTVSGTQPNGTRFEVDGCDLFTIRGNKITTTISYRKCGA